MRKRKITATLLMVCMLMSLFSVSSLFAEEESTGKGAESRGYQFGESPLMVDINFFGAIPIHFWGAIATQVNADNPDLGSDTNDGIQFLTVAGYTAMSVLSGTQLGFTASGLFPLMTTPSEDGKGSTEFHVGGDISNGFSLGSLLNLSVHAAARWGFRGTTEDGEASYSFLQPYFGYQLIARDLAGKMVESYEILGDATAVDDDFEAEGLTPPEDKAGHYLELGFRYGFAKGDKKYSFFDIQYSLPLNDYGVGHLRLGMGFQMMGLTF